MKILILCFLTAALSVAAQPSPYRVLSPIMKNPNQRQAVSSVKPSDLQEPNDGPQTASGPAVAAQKPREIVAQIDTGLSASAISIIGRITGIKGTMYVTNNGGDAIVPHVEFAICDRTGTKIGTATKVGDAIAAGSAGKVDVVATNVGSCDLKLMKLSSK